VLKLRCDQLGIAPPASPSGYAIAPTDWRIESGRQTLGALEVGEQFGVREVCRGQFEGDSQRLVNATFSRPVHPLSSTMCPGYGMLELDSVVDGMTGSLF
jgi:hypothetical protein